jgi:hypothetical protein
LLVEAVEGTAPDGVRLLSAAPLTRAAMRSSESGTGFRGVDVCGFDCVSSVEVDVLVCAVAPLGAAVTNAVVVERKDAAA